MTDDGEDNKRRFKKRKAGVSVSSSSLVNQTTLRATARKVLALFVDGDARVSLLKLPSAVGEAELEALVTTQHLMIITCTLLSQRSETFRSMLRTVGGIAVCVNIIEDSLLAVSLDVETSSKLPASSNIKHSTKGEQGDLS